MSIPYIRPQPDPKASSLSIVSIRFRCIRPGCITYREDGTVFEDHQGHGKYMTVAGDRPRLYNTKALLEPSDIVCVTEGELDAITATLCGKPAVGVPGVESWLPQFRVPLLGYETVYVLADGDEPGRRFANKVAGELPNAKVIPMPAGHDVNSLVLAEGWDALLDRIR
ncbi:toprim domain-containing protein [Nocardia sp. NPDC059246]|uniref:toprim domain-containing protein n=1 Tax=unclassified Nocardia TaxID=2637762 RepID=UPI0036AC0B7D